MADRVAMLVMVTSANNNKYYNMIQEGDRLTVEFGRIGSGKQTAYYPGYMWDKKYREKIRKGYQDQTANQTLSHEPVQATKYPALINALLEYAREHVHNNYTVTAGQVSPQQLSEAQSILSRTALITDVTEINEHLIQLYTVIPRKMKKVTEHLISDHDQLANILANEQDTLDTLAGQVGQVMQPEQPEIKLPFSFIATTDDDHKTVTDMLGAEAHRITDALKVTNDQTDREYNLAVIGGEELLWHGSRNPNWWHIAKTGLMIKPPGIRTTGSMFGNGIYFADLAKKSIGYTSVRNSYWARGSSNIGVLGIYKVKLGKQLIVDSHQSWCSRLNSANLAARGQYDSVWGKRGRSLHNNEYIVYQPQQCTLRFLVQIS